MPEMLETIEHETGPEPQAAVIWLHGLGADGHDFAPIVPAVAPGPDKPLRFVFPHAPVRPVTMNAGMPMRAWFDILAAERDAATDEAGIWNSVASVEALIARERARGISADRIVLAGFSQGGAIALITALTHAEKLAGVIALSTFLPMADEVAKRAAPANRELNIFMAHGEHDNMVSFRYGRNSRRQLAEIGARITWREYPMEHTVIPEEIAEIRTYLNGLLA